MNHLMTLFDFERGPDGIAMLTILGLFLLVCAGISIWVFVTTKPRKPTNKCKTCGAFLTYGCCNSEECAGCYEDPKHKNWWRLTR